MVNAAARTDLTPIRDTDSGFVLREVMNSSPIGKVLVDRNGRIAYANPSFARMLGLSPADCIGLGPADIVAPEMAEQAREQVRNIVNGDIDGYREQRIFVRRDGTRFWCEVSASVIHGSSSDRGYIILQFVDIDGQKKAEEALIAAENRWNFALESAGQGVWDHDLRAGKSFHSRMWKIMRGLDPDGDYDDTQEGWLERVHPEDRDHARTEERRLADADTGYHEFEYRERHRDGHYIWILSRGRAVERAPDGTVLRAIGTDTDVTRIKTAEALLADAFAAMADALVLFDRDERLVYCNEQYRRLFPRTAHVRVPGMMLVDVLRASVAAGEPSGVDPDGEAYVESTRQGAPRRRRMGICAERRPLAPGARQDDGRWRLSQRRLRRHRAEGRRAGPEGAQPPADRTRPHGRADRSHQPPRTSTRRSASSSAARSAMERRSACS